MSDQASVSSPGERWVLTFYGEKIGFVRYAGGVQQEAYRLVDRAEASVWAVAVVNGLQPPKHLLPCDTPIR